MENPTCIFCSCVIHNNDFGEPYLSFMALPICLGCSLELIVAIYNNSNGEGGLTHVVFRECLSSHINRKHRIQLKNYRKTFKELLHKYNFKCFYCGNDKNLTIDHIHPVRKGGNDHVSNLQILCKSCNSRKGAKVE